MSLPKNLLSLVILIFFFYLSSIKTVSAASYYVSKNGGNTDGTSWTTAWNELNQINWTNISAGDTIFIDGGSSYMTYSTILTPTKSGTAQSPITIQLSTESGRNGKAIFHGGRQAQLPECGQLSYPPYSAQGDVVQNDRAIYFSNVSYIVVDGTKWNGIEVTRSNYGLRFTPTSSHITIKNLRIYDNGEVYQAADGSVSGLWYSDDPGVRIEGSNHTFERVNIHDNGQDAFQAGNTGGNNSNNLDYLTIRESWLHNERQHSGTDNGPSGDTADELGAPSQGASYNGFSESFNWCRHSDAVQINVGTNVEGFLFEDSVFGPGFTNTFMLSDTSPGAYLTNFTLRNSLIIKGADNNINTKAATTADTWNISNITVHSPNTKSNGIRLYGDNFSITNSIFYDSNAFFENGLDTDSGNCTFSMTGHSFGSIHSDPLFTSINNADPFSLDNYIPQAGSPCAGKGSSIISVDHLLGIVGALSLPNTSTNQNLVNNIGPFVCTDSTPVGKPNLFQVTTDCNSATLHFLPILGANYYYFSYGRTPEASEYGATQRLDFNYGGVASFKVNHLSPNQTYYFKILPANQCAPGLESNILKATTQSCQIAVKTSATPTATPLPKATESVSYTPTPRATQTSLQTARPVFTNTATPMVEPSDKKILDNQNLLLITSIASSFGAILLLGGYFLLRRRKLS